MTLVTLFTAPKPFIDPHISIIQRNTLQNWSALGDAVEVVVIGNEMGIPETCQELNIHHLPDVRCNDQGTPLISSIFDLARDFSHSPYLMYSNADILFLPELSEKLLILASECDQFLAVGQRWDLDIKESLNFSNSWGEYLRRRVRDHGTLHGQTGSDYFIFPRACYQDIPDFAVGRAGWDNWMIFWARWRHWPVVNMSKGLMVIHQNHDYAHLPGGVRHYQVPETATNVRIGGGRRTIFTLTDATAVFEDGEIRRKPLDWSTLWREVEIFPLVRLHSRLLGWISFAIFHPGKAYGEIKGWLAYKLKQGKDHDG